MPAHAMYRRLSLGCDVTDSQLCIEAQCSKWHFYKLHCEVLKRIIETSVKAGQMYLLMLGYFLVDNF